MKKRTYGEEIINFLSKTISDLSNCEDELYRFSLIRILSNAIFEISDIEKDSIISAEILSDAKYNEEK